MSCMWSLLEGPSVSATCLTTEPQIRTVEVEIGAREDFWVHVKMQTASVQRGGTDNETRWQITNLRETRDGIILPSP